MLIFIVITPLNYLGTSVTTILKIVYSFQHIYVEKKSTKARLYK